MSYAPRLLGAAHALTPSTATLIIQGVLFRDASAGLSMSAGDPSPDSRVGSARNATFFDQVDAGCTPALLVMPASLWTCCLIAVRHSCISVLLMLTLE